uniref:integrin alpha-M-like isoform X2 n=1 Tax=Myxine glutinosa TaxID=7769 RepID=UPI00358ECC50
MFLPEVGARPRAKKVLLVITDGQTYDGVLFKDVTKEAEKKDVIRFAVGVGKASEGEAKRQLETIASKPIENHLFLISNYRALAKILHKLQKNIFIIEGESSNITSFETELAEPGLALHVSKDVTLFGAPGMYDWTGAVLQQANGKLVTSIREVQMKNRKAIYLESSDSYIGYALSTVYLRSRRLIAAGAPRFQHTGKVMVMSLHADTGTMMLEQQLLGLQLGSSFGSEMCSLDINNDGYTDLLLVSAPLYHVRGDEGRVYIYTVQEDDSANKVKLQLQQELTGKEGDSTGRFGSSLATMGDMNGDGRVDVAVGAPLEEDNGVVYMFLGTDHGLQNPAAQRLMAADFSPSVRLFGWSLASGRDLTGDDIPELVVGALGGVTVFSGRPVLAVDTAVNSLPSEIPLWPLRCKEQKWKTPLAMRKDMSRTTDMESRLQPLPLNITVCFSARAMNTKPDRGSQTVELRYDLLLDGKESTPRAKFGMTNHLQQSITLQVTDIQFCETQKIYVSCDDKDMVTPIHVALNFSLQNSLAALWMIEPNLDTHRQEQIHFARDCGIDGICTPNMTLAVSLESGELVLGRDHSLRVEVQLRNFGEDAYYTELRLRFPPILRYSSVQKVAGDVHCRLLANGLAEHSSLFCPVDPPVFKMSAKSSFILNFWVTQVISNDTSLSLQAFAVREKTQYLSVFKTDNGNVSLAYNFLVENIGASVQQLKLHIAAPLSIDKHEFAEYTNPMINTTSTCSKTIQRKPKKEGSRDIWDCSHATCAVWDCTIQTMEKGDIFTLSLQGHVILPTITKISENRVTIIVTMFVRLDENIYRQVPAGGTVHHQAKVDKVIEVQSYLNLVPIIAGSLLGGLFLFLLIMAVLYKVGFFKRHYKNLQNNNAAEDAGASDETKETQ